MPAATPQSEYQRRLYFAEKFWLTVAVAAANANGRLTSMTDGAGSETYTYDQLGRITQLGKVISGAGGPDPRWVAQMRAAEEG